MSGFIDNLVTRARAFWFGTSASPLDHDCQDDCMFCPSESDDYLYANEDFDCEDVEVEPPARHDSTLLSATGFEGPIIINGQDVSTEPNEEIKERKIVLVYLETLLHSSNAKYFEDDLEIWQMQLEENKDRCNQLERFLFAQRKKAEQAASVADVQDMGKAYDDLMGIKRQPPKPIETPTKRQSLHQRFYKMEESNSRLWARLFKLEHPDIPKPALVQEIPETHQMKAMNVPTLKQYLLHMTFDDCLTCAQCKIDIPTYKGFAVHECSHGSTLVCRGMTREGKFNKTYIKRPNDMREQKIPGDLTGRTYKQAAIEDQDEMSFIESADMLTKLLDLQPNEQNRIIREYPAIGIIFNTNLDGDHRAAIKITGAKTFWRRILAFGQLGTKFDTSGLSWSVDVQPATHDCTSLGNVNAPRPDDEFKNATFDLCTALVPKLEPPTGEEAERQHELALNKFADDVKQIVERRGGDESIMKLAFACHPLLGELLDSLKPGETYFCSESEYYDTTKPIPTSIDLKCDTLTVHEPTRGEVKNTVDEYMQQVQRTGMIDLKSYPLPFPSTEGDLDDMAKALPPYEPEPGDEVQPNES